MATVVGVIPVHLEIGRLAGFASPELRGLFEEWVKALEGEVVEFLKEKGSCPPC